MTTTDTTQDSYLAERLRSIFASTPPTPPPSHAQARTVERWPYYVGAQARDALIDMAGGPRRISAFLTRLYEANPLPTHWQDTRPPTLKASDYARLTSTPPILPIWSTGQGNREGGRLCLVLPLATVHGYAAIARHWGIAPQAYVVRSDYHPMELLRTTPIDRFHAVPPHALTTHVLRAIALGYLTPERTV